jgi:hypothetical protein
MKMKIKLFGVFVLSKIVRGTLTENGIVSASSVYPYPG